MPRRSLRAFPEHSKEATPLYEDRLTITIDYSRFNIYQNDISPLSSLVMNSKLVLQVVLWVSPQDIFLSVIKSSKLLEKLISRRLMKPG